MKSMRFPVSEPDLSPLELEYVDEAIRSTWISSSGKFLDRFEEEFCELTSSSHALAVSNGTVALHLILLGLGVEKGDEVIVPSFTYIASVNAIRYVGATPVFIDVNDSTWGIEASSVLAAITSRTKAVIGVHVYGQPFDLGPIQALCREKGIFLIEDAAEAPFSTYFGRPVGSFGVASSFSFYGNKVITSGEGGAVVTSDANLASKMRMIRSQGMDPKKRYFFPIIGHNFRLTNVAAAILCAQLQRLPEILEKRHEVCNTYDKELWNVSGVELQTKATWSTWTPWLASILISGGELQRDALALSLSSLGIETRPFFIPIHQMPPYKEFSIDAPLMAVTDSLSERGINLPTSSKMSSSDAKEISREIKRLIASR